MLLSTHVGLLVLAAGCLAFALFLEGALVTVPAGNRHGHAHLPVAVHGLAFVSVLLSLWPSGRRVVAASRRLRLDWHAVVVGAVVAAIASGRIMVGAAASLVFSLVSLLWRQRLESRMDGSRR